jgi:hippurate hydrolase
MLSADTPAIKSRVADVQTQIAQQLPALTDLYKILHRNPELSLRETETAARMAKELRTIGFTVTEKVGGLGVVGVFKNGTGPTVLVRCDMDALPVTERTGVPYASQVRARDAAGNEVGVMHACGHDLHMACWVGTARTLVNLKDKWAGTLVFIAQPAEEVGIGARQMLADGLFTRFPKPDYALALHCDSRLEAGKIAYTEGLALANVDTVEILVKGKGGHGAAPHTTIDPIVLAARIVLDLQTIVSREMNPLDPAVVTVGSSHGGTKSNIIPSEVKLQLTVRTTKDDVRKQVLDAIARISKAAALGARAPEPTVTVLPDEFTPATINDVPLTRKTVTLFREVLGAANVTERAPIMGGEDFGRYGRAGVPICMYFLGTIDAQRWAAAQQPDAPPLPSMHADSYYPTIEPSLRTGVLTLSLAVWNVLGKE